MVRKFLIAALMPALALLAACSTAPVGQTAQVGGVMPPPDPVKLTTNANSYRIGPLDVLDVAVFQVPDLTRTVQVDAAGQITLPLVGSVPAAGKSVAELQTDVADKLRARYLQSPEVTIAVKEYASQKVTVDGSVTQPGVYPITGRTTLLQALAMAKGTDGLANEKRVVIFRTVNGQRMGALFDIQMVRAGTLDDPEIYGNDTITVERSGAKSMFRQITSASPLLGLFRPF